MHLRWRVVGQALVHTFLAVEVKVLVQSLLQSWGGIIVQHVCVLALHAAPQTFDENVVRRPPSAIYANPDTGPARTPMKTSTCSGQVVHGFHAKATIDSGALRKLDAMPPEWVADMARNRWTTSIGISGRHGLDYAGAELKRQGKREEVGAQLNCAPTSTTCFSSPAR